MSAEYAVERSKITRAPSHPGIIFERTVLPGLGRRTIGEIAMLLGVSRQTLNRVMSGRIGNSPDMAVRLGKLCGNGTELWLALKARYNAWEAPSGGERDREDPHTIVLINEAPGVDRRR